MKSGGGDYLCWITIPDRQQSFENRMELVALTVQQAVSV